ncbi:hypothetical protein Bca4012_056178 [Brassica carinata]
MVAPWQWENAIPEPSLNSPRSLRCTLLMLSVRDSKSRLTQAVFTFACLEVSNFLLYAIYARVRGDEKLTLVLHLSSSARRNLVEINSHPSDTFSSNPAIQWAIRTIMKEEAPIALYKGIVPSLSLVSHGAIQFTAYEELRKVIVVSILKRRKPESADNLLVKSSSST